MAQLKKPTAYFAIILTLAILVELFAHTPTINSTPQIQQTNQLTRNQIALSAANLEAFNCYNTNGTPPLVEGNTALFSGAKATNMYQDLVSYASLTADKSLVLEAQITANVTSFSIGEDQFAVFAADDIVNYKSDEFGFVLPEMGDAWYAYIQSPQIEGFFAWHPLTQADPSQPHDFKAVYSNGGLGSYVDFYVDGRLLWTTKYPDVSGMDYHLVLTSHKVSTETFDTSQNKMQIDNASLSDRLNRIF